MNRREFIASIVATAAVGAVAPQTALYSPMAPASPMTPAFNVADYEGCFRELLDEWQRTFQYYPAIDGAEWNLMSILAKRLDLLAAWSCEMMMNGYARPAIESIGLLASMNAGEA